MATVIYGGMAIIPAPLVSFQDEPIIAGNQHRIGNTYKITINGTLVSFKGSPASASYGGKTSSASWGGYNNQFWIDSGYPPDESNPTYSYHQLYMIESKQEALRTLFATEGQWLEFQSADGSAPMKAQVKNVQINFEEGIWFTECKYTISCETDVIYLNGQVYQGLPFNELIQQASESWEIQPADNIKTFNVTHTVNAVGKRSFDSIGNEVQQPWQIAKNFVNSQLVLGWNGTSAYSAISGHAIFNQSNLASGVLNFNNYSPYNFTRTDSVDELGGSYSCTESWILAVGSGTNIYTISSRPITEDPYTNISVNIQGSIRGYYVDLFDYDRRLDSASYVWSQLGGPSGLLNLITPYVTGYVLNQQPTQVSLDYNYNEGVINYAADFNNTLYHGDAFEQWTLSRKTSADNYMTTFTIAGNIKGRRYVNDTDQTASFGRAYTWWATLSGGNYSILYDRILSSKYFPEAAAIGVQSDPFSKSVDLNEGDGTIVYSFDFNNRQNDSTYPSDYATDEYQISKQFDRQDGITHYTINGTVKGLNIIDYANARKSKFDNASGYFYTYVVPNMYSRVQSYYSVSLPDTAPVATEIGFSIGEGMVTYQYSYWNVFPPLLPGAYSEKIDIAEVNYNQQVQTTAQIPVPGRKQGSVIQDVQTTIVKSRTITIETVVGPTGSITDITVGFNAKPIYDSYIYQLQPTNSYCNNWTSNWDYRFGRLTVVAEFIYE